MLSLLVYYPNPFLLLDYIVSLRLFAGIHVKAIQLDYLVIIETISFDR